MSRKTGKRAGGSKSSGGGGRAFLIDGTAFCYRAFYAIRGLTTSDGRPTNAVYGFATMLQSLLEKEHPEYLAVAFDVGKPTFRHQQFEDYKAQRKPMPDPLVEQLPLVKTLLAAYRIPIFEQEGYEAEDVLGTLAKRLVASDVRVFLVTGDKDVLQLVNSHITVYNPEKEPGVIDASTVRARFGVGPEQIVDFLALMGDKIDNIPGVPGIGAKTAAQLLEQFGSLDRLYANLTQVQSAAQQEALEEAREQVDQARALTRIDTDVPVTVELEDVLVREPDWRKLRTLFRELDFKRLLRAIETEGPAQEGSAKVVRRVTNEQEWHECHAQLYSATSVALACWPVWAPGDTGGDRAGSIPAGEEVAHRAGGAAGEENRKGKTSRRKASPDQSAPVLANAGTRRLTGVVVGLAVDAEQAWAVWLDQGAVREPALNGVVEWLTAAKARKIGHDLKQTMRVLGHLGVELKGVVGDTMIAAHLLNPIRTEQRLPDLSDDVLEHRLSETHLRAWLADCQESLLTPARQTGLQGLLGMPAEALNEVGGAVCAVIELEQRLSPALTEAGLRGLYDDLELPLIDVLASMEATGIAIDVDYLAGLRATMNAKLVQLTEELYHLAGCVFNLNSPKQLSQILFERLQLPIIKRIKTGASTDSNVLHQLAERHPFPRLLVEYRELTKLVSTYLEALPKLVNASTGRVHTSLNQTATATGRLSSSEPNLQNIPIKTEVGRQIRRAFIPGPAEWSLMSADYSQIELRILAHLCGDSRLIEAFRHGADIHRSTASLTYGIPEAEVTPQMRNRMKAVNFGILYGMGAHGLARELGISHEDASAFIAAYFERYPDIQRYITAQVEKAQADGFVQTLLGRRRFIPELRSHDGGVRQFGQRLAVNTPIQGTAADLVKRAMIDIARALRTQGLESRMLLQVHDELVFEVPPEESEPLARLIREIMEGAIVLAVPLIVTVKSGPNWLDLTVLELPRR